MPARVKPLLLSALLAFATVGSACASSAPYVSVVGTSRSQTNRFSLLVVVEIHNPTRTPVRLSELQYTLARRGESATRGTVRLRDTVAPGRTSTVDIAVPMGVGAQLSAAYDLSGRLRGYAGDVEVNWQIAALAHTQTVAAE